MELKPISDQAFNSASIGILSTDQIGNVAAINQQAAEIICKSRIPLYILSPLKPASISSHLN